MEEIQDKLKTLERENSELKAAKLMSMLGGSTSANQLLSSTSSKANTSALERQVETLRLQLSEKTNDFLKLKDENERIRDQYQELLDKQTMI